MATVEMFQPNSPGAMPPGIRVPIIENTAVGSRSKTGIGNVPGLSFSVATIPYISVAAPLNSAESGSFIPIASYYAYDDKGNTYSYNVHSAWMLFTGGPVGPPITDAVLRFFLWGYDNLIAPMPITVRAVKQPITEPFRPISLPSITTLHQNLTTAYATGTFNRNLYPTAYTLNVTSIMQELATQPNWDGKAMMVFQREVTGPPYTWPTNHYQLHLTADRGWIPDNPSYTYSRILVTYTPSGGGRAFNRGFNEGLNGGIN